MTQKYVMWQSLSCVWLFATPWTTACQTPLSTEFSRQEYSSGLPFPSPGDIPNSGIKAGSPALQADSLPSEPPEKPEAEVHWHSKLHNQNMCQLLGRSKTPSKEFISKWFSLYNACRNYQKQRQKLSVADTFIWDLISLILSQGQWAAHRLSKHTKKQVIMSRNGQKQLTIERALPDLTYTKQRDINFEITVLIWFKE